MERKELGKTLLVPHFKISGFGMMALTAIRNQEELSWLGSQLVGTYS